MVGLLQPFSWRILEGCLSFLKAHASIWRILSLVKPMASPISCKVKQCPSGTFSSAHLRKRLNRVVASLPLILGTSLMAFQKSGASSVLFHARHLVSAFGSQGVFPRFAPGPFATTDKYHLSLGLRFSCFYWSDFFLLTHA